MRYPRKGAPQSGILSFQVPKITLLRMWDFLTGGSRNELEESQRRLDDLKEKCERSKDSHADLAHLQRGGG